MFKVVHIYLFFFFLLTPLDLVLKTQILKEDMHDNELCPKCNFLLLLTGSDVYGQRRAVHLEASRG